MAALTRPDKANYEVHEFVKVDTTGEFCVLCSKKDLFLCFVLVSFILVYMPL
jgi:hypothetical protein